MERSNRQRGATLNGKPPDQQKAPTWRLFQLAFILLNLDGLVDPAHPDRPVVDLLFFPTGGGKTEAYLGLAAFAMSRGCAARTITGLAARASRRHALHAAASDARSAPRAAGLICALELERKALGRLRTWPIEIGLWVGGGATPNNLGSAKNRKENTARLLAGAGPQRQRPRAGATQSLPMVRNRDRQEQFPGCTRPAATPQRLDIRL